ncbi:MAG: hypothetical protein ACYCWW_13930, partial [Deltaproteobacteria bacterium]
AHLFVGNLKVALIAQLGKGSPLLGDFGIKDGTARKKPTAAEKSASAVRGGETRKLRHTQGKVQKLAKKFVGQVSPATPLKGGGLGGNDGGASNGSSGNNGA